MVRVTDAYGKTVYLQTISGTGKQHKLNVAGFSAGVYYVQVISGNKINTIKFVKE